MKRVRERDCDFMKLAAKQYEMYDDRQIDRH